MASKRRLLAPPLGLLVACALSATALAGTGDAGAGGTVRSDGVAATLSYVHNAKNAVAPFSDLHLTIVRDGKKLYGAVIDNAFCGKLCAPNLPDAQRVLDVEADGQPDVLLNLYTGGAHCCNVTDVFRYDTAHDDYSSLLHIWGDPGYRLVQLDASKAYEWLTYDDRFAYEFAAFAFSGLPLQILRLHAGTFVDVTRSYPQLVRGDAAQQWKYYLDNRKDGTGLGYLAAWAADEYTLSRTRVVATTLAQLDKAAQLRSNSSIWPGGSKFVANLARFLKQTGYAR